MKRFLFSFFSLCPLLFLAGCRSMSQDLDEQPAPPVMGPTPAPAYVPAPISRPNPPFNTQAFVEGGRLPASVRSAPTRSLPAGFVPPGQRINGPLLSAEAAPLQSTVQSANQMLNQATTLADCQKILDLLTDASRMVQQSQQSPSPNNERFSRQAPYLNSAFRSLRSAIAYKSSIIQGKNVAASQQRLTAALQQAYSFARRGDAVR